ncbi:MAG TPA: glycosyltransferase family 39 protein [Bryobacteraceae bacterium]|nr:glycosyltransferase family 39 protein [Bryobacteraceae bacterium]
MVEAAQSHSIAGAQEHTGSVLSVRLRFALLAIAAAILFLGAIRLGDLAGYDDAMYSVEAKGIANTGDWLTPKTRGYAALEHPPLFVWTQAAFFKALGISDLVAKLPSALCALAVVLLVYWLARRLLRDTLAASVAMFVMLATPYFIKYAGRAMTDVPVTFLFLCAVCAWLLAEEQPAWYLAAGAFTAMALMVRGLIGFALPLMFGAHLIAMRRRPAWRFLIPAGIIAVAPLAAWYAYMLHRYRDTFVDLHQGWLEREVYGSLTPAWRRYTGAIEYAWMLAKSYWPWLPAMLAGIVVLMRERKRQLLLLLCWAGAVFLLCAVARSRVLRYMLPAYPAFAILSALALLRWIPRRVVERAMAWIAPLAAVAAIAIVLLTRPVWHASEIRKLAEAQGGLIQPGEPVGFYDKGDPRYDETNQLEWYGAAVPVLLMTPTDLARSLTDDSIHLFIVDRPTYKAVVTHLPHEVVGVTDHLVSFRLEPH